MSRRLSPGWRPAGTAAVSSANRRSRPGCSLSSPKRGTALDVTPSRAARGDDAGVAVSALTILQVGSVISYVIAIVIPALDAVIPVLPSESVIIALGVATA